MGSHDRSSAGGEAMSDEEEIRQLLAATKDVIQRSAENRQVTLSEFQALRAENARLREALSFYVKHGAWPVELVRDGGDTARAALEGKP